MPQELCQRSGFVRDSTAAGEEKRANISVQSGDGMPKTRAVLLRMVTVKVRFRANFTKFDALTENDTNQDRTEEQAPDVQR